MLRRGMMAGGEVLPVVTWNPSDKSSRINLSLANIRAMKTTGTTSTWDMARSTYGHSTGKRYFEVLCVLSGGSDQSIMVGIANASAPLDTASGFPGGDANGYGYYVFDGNKYHAATGSAYGTAWDANTTIGVAVDFAAGKIWFANENTWFGDPVAGTGEAFSGISGTFYAAASILNLTSLTTDGRFKSSGFVYSPPAGFGPWGG